ncbi:hypothetical protein MASR2M47_07580 [Draconibacterium sp.]
MKRRKFVTNIGAGALAVSATPLMANGMVKSEKNQASPALKGEEVQHMVIFDLKHEKGSAQADKFLKDGRDILTKIPVVQHFQVFNQVSIKNDYTYGFSMVFAGQSEYTTYNNHPDHVAFVENRWNKEVSRFLEIDFKAYL